jgi:hypothetical protein
VKSLGSLLSSRAYLILLLRETTMVRQLSMFTVA